MRPLRAFLSLLIVSLAPLMLGSAAVARAQSSDDARLSLTKNVMDEIVGGQFTRVCGRLSPDLKDLVTEDKLQFVWNRLMGVSGSFQKQISQTTRNIRGDQVYVSKSQFENSKVELRLMFDDTNQITHIWIAPVSDLSPETMEASAKEAANLLGQNHFDQLNAKFDDDLKNDMPPEHLAMSWSHVMLHLGQFKHIKLAVKDPDLDMVDVRCEFEHGDITVRIGFDPSGKINGLWMLPVESEPDNTPNI